MGEPGKAAAADRREVGGRGRSRGRRGNLEEAERIFRNALSTREQIDGPNHIDVTITLGKLSVFYWRQARYAEAEEAVARKLSILEWYLGPDHIRLTDELDSLALVLLAQGPADEAGPLFQRALQIRRTTPGIDPLSIATSHEHLGDQRRATGALDEAEAFYLQALSAREPVQSANHPDVTRTINSLALVYDEQARYAEARPLYARALAAIRESGGPDSADYGAVLNNLGILNLRLGNNEEAAAQLAESVAIREQHLGPAHPRVAEGLTGLALAHQRLDRMDDARDAATRASFIQSERARLGHMDRPEIRAARQVHLRLLDILLDSGGNTHDADAVFRAVQAAHSSVAASAVTRLAERYALGGGSNARWVRIRQDAQDDFAEFDAQLTALSGQSGTARNPAEMERLVAARDDARLTIDATHEMLKAIVGPDYQDRIRPGPLGVEEAQGLLGPGEAILTMTVAEKRGTGGADAVFLVAITPQGGQTARAEIPDLSGKIGALRRKLSPATVGGRPGLLRFPVDTAHELYHALFKPFTGLLAETQHLLVVPDGAFASLPLGVLLTASEVARMRLNAQWVILSACNTAAPDGTPGAEGLSGLTSAFFYAGAQSVFVSHWPVVSDATVKLTTGMLSALTADPELRASEAHRRSMLALMNDPDEPMFAHPLFWGPFVVVGDGGALQ